MNANNNLEDSGGFSGAKYLWVGDISEESAVGFHEDVMQSFEENPRKPIIIHISSYGGEVDALFSMLDTIDAVRAVAPPEFKFLTVVMGKACSAGAVLLSYGDFRFCTQNSRVMIHQVVGGSWGSHPDNEVEFSEVSRVNSRMLRILKDRCKLKASMKAFKDKLSHNLYLSPKQAKEFGIIDIIGYPKLTEHVSYDVQVLNSEPPKKVKNASNRRANQSATKN